MAVESDPGWAALAHVSSGHIAAHSFQPFPTPLTTFPLPPFPFTQPLRQGPASAVPRPLDQREDIHPLGLASPGAGGAEPAVARLSGSRKREVMWQSLRHGVWGGGDRGASTRALHGGGGELAPLRTACPRRCPPGCNVFGDSHSDNRCRAGLSCSVRATCLCTTHSSSTPRCSLGLPRSGLQGVARVFRTLRRSLQPCQAFSQPPFCRCAVQVMGEKLSRVNACPSANQDHRRWTWRMTVRLAGGGGQEEG